MGQTYRHPTIVNAQTITVVKTITVVQAQLEASWTLCHNFLAVYTHDCDKEASLSNNVRQLVYTTLTFLAMSASCSKTWRHIRPPGPP